MQAESPSASSAAGNSRDASIHSCQAQKDLFSHVLVRDDMTEDTSIFMALCSRED
jgi:hypothetical protein